MTECGNTEIRDLLPDFAGETLSSVEMSRAQAHVDSCAECGRELALLRTARAVRPAPRTIDVSGIVAQLPRPRPQVALDTDSSVISLNAHRALAAEHHPTSSRGSRPWLSRSVWRMAASIGVMIAGGWSILMVRSGGLTQFASERADSAQLASAVAAGAVPVESTTSTRVGSRVASENDVAVSFGDLGNYTDDELKRVLERLDTWDGATSTEAVVTTPIMNAPPKGAPE